MKKVFSLVALCLASSSVAFAGPIQADKAKALADNFLGTANSSATKVTYRAKAKGCKTTSQNLYYVINKGDNQGFVVISGDDRTMPVLAYAKTGHLNEQDILNHPSMRYLFGEYENQIVWAQENIADIPSEEYKALAARRFTPAANQIIVSPLLDLHNDRQTRRAHTIGWGQDWPFNSFCPTLTYTDNYGYSRDYPSVSGCVATAISQVLRWHEWPTKAKGRVGYSFQGTWMTLDFDKAGAEENKAYDWQQMPEAVTTRGMDATTFRRINATQEDNIGRLLRDVGYSVKMQYGAAEAGGSYAYLYDCVRPLINNFSYRSNLRHVMRSSYRTDAQWIAQIQDELQNYGPIVYAGTTASARPQGHCFVIDGLAQNGYVHVNWGWNNQEDSWCLLNVLKPGREGIGGADGTGYRANQQMLRYLSPDRAINPNPQPNPEPQPNPNPQPDPTKNPLYIKAKANLTEVGKESKYVYVSVGNQFTSNYQGQFKLSAKKQGASTYTDLVTTSYASTIYAGSSKEISFYTDFSKLAPGTYDLQVSYMVDYNWVAITESAGTVTVKGETPAAKGAQLAVVSDASINVNTGESANISVAMTNNGDADFNGKVTLYAGYTEICSGDIAFILNDNATLTFATNEAFKRLAAGKYNLKVAYTQNYRTIYAKLNGSDVIGTLTIVKKDEPAPKPQPTPNIGVAKGDMDMQSVQFYQNGKYIGRSYSSVAKDADLTARVNMHSSYGFDGDVKFYVTDTYNGGAGVTRNLEITKHVTLAAGESGYVEVTFKMADLTGTRYYVNALYNNGTKDIYSAWRSATFYIKSYSYAYGDNAPNYEMNEGKTNGPVIRVKTMPNGVKYIGFEDSDNNLENTTGINEINVVENGFNLFPSIATTEITIVVSEDAQANIYNVSGAIVKTLNLVKGENKVSIEGLTQGMYLVKTKQTTAKFVKK